MRAQADDVTQVLVNGETVLKDGRPTRFDVLEVGRELAERLAEEPALDDEARLVEALIPHLETFYQAWEMPPIEPHIPYNSRT